MACEAASRQLLELAARVARSDSTVLISGESGTGKEVLARYIHQQSPRRRSHSLRSIARRSRTTCSRPRCSATRRALSPGPSLPAGKFEQAEGGTLLLDEISEMPLGLQAAIAGAAGARGGAGRWAQADRPGYPRAGYQQPRHGRRSGGGRFREDLYYRLSVFPLAWQPLRERAGDILPLAERLLARHVAKMKHAPVRLSAGARACLQAHAWPGNVRELDNAVQRALILQQGGVIEAADFCLAGAIPLSAAGAVAVSASPVAVTQDSGGLGDDMRRHEFQMIIDTLRAERGRREAAESLASARVPCATSWRRCVMPGSMWKPACSAETVIYRFAGRAGT